MTRRDPERASWAYYAAIILFVAVLAFAVLGLVRSSSLAGASTARGPEPRSTTPRVPQTALAAGPVATPQIPPPTPGEPTEPPSRTYIHPPPELAGTPPPVPAAQPR
jgi:hypothetical protein